MKKKIISGITLAAVFITALVCFSFVLNKGSDATTADMGGAELPRISFYIEGQQINSLSGYTEDMEVTTMRDTIIPIEVGTTVDAMISEHTDKITSLSYEVCTLDGSKVLKKEKLKKVSDTISLDLGDTLKEEEERLLKIHLQFENEKQANYYTRIVRAEDFNVQQCMDFAKDFHDKTFSQDGVHELKKYLSREVLKKSKSLQKVTLGSDIAAVGWGDLNPEVIGDIQWEIKESNSTYTSILFQYKVRCKGTEEEETVYNVNEFFKVRYLKGKASLEDYNRQMQQKFNGNKSCFDRKGILLGYSSPDVSYLANKDGNHISFIQEREVWHYDSEDNEISRVFSFSNEEKPDIRDENDDHSVRLLDIEGNGNTVFAVYGYMNRGIHEGQVGVAVYYFDVKKGHTEEIAFIPSIESGVMTADNFGKMIYYNRSQNTLYALIDGELNQIKLDSLEQQILVKGLTEEQYRTSEDRKMLAYQKNGSLTEATAIDVWNLKNGKNYEISVSSDEVIRPLGFVGEDVIYGIGKKADIGESLSGDTVIPLYRVEIQNEKNEVVKTYGEEGSYVIDAGIEKNMITLQKVQKSGDQYVNITPEYITNNQQQDKDTISIDTYVSEIKGNEIRITDSKGLKETEPQLLYPKQIVYEKPTVVTFETEKQRAGYYVYGTGKFQGAFSHAGDAIALADDLKGTVVTGKQTLLWERGNRMLRYNIKDMQAFGKNEGETSLEACLRQVLALEGKDVPVSEEIKGGKTAMDILNENLKGEAVDLSGCTLEQLYYIINQGTPVIVSAGSGNAILLTGYDDKNVTYINPDAITKTTEPTGSVQTMIDDSQGKLIGYVK